MQPGTYVIPNNLASPVTASDIMRVLALDGHGNAQVLFLLSGNDEVYGVDSLKALPPCFTPDPDIFPHA